jgi:hypothetical protein
VRALSRMGRLRRRTYEEAWVAGEKAAGKIPKKTPNLWTSRFKGTGPSWRSQG